MPRLLKSIQEGGSLHIYLQTALFPIDLKVLLSSNLKMGFLCKIIENLTVTFWREVLEAWCKCTHYEPLSREQVLDQNLWLNSFILMNKSTLYWPSFITYNILKIRDLLNDEGMFFSYDEIRAQHPIWCTFVEYYGLISAIPRQWKLLINNNTIHASKSPTNLLLNSGSNTSKSAYQLLIEKVVNFLLHLVEKWSNDLNQQLTINILKNSFNSIFKLTISCNLRAFQFKFLHRILPTNHLLFIWKIKDSNACTFCGQVDEKLKHLFYECDIVKQFWPELGEWIKHECGITYNFNMFDIMMLNINETTPIALLTVLLIAKVYIYKCRQSSNIPSISFFEAYIKQYIMIEEKIALKCNKILQHYKKWQMFSIVEY